VRDRIELVEKAHPEISMRKQCALLGVARSTVDYQAVAVDPEDNRIRRLLDEIYLIDPCLGSRKLVTLLGRDYSVKINRKRVRRLRSKMGQEAIWCKPRTSIADDGHRKYSYLLRNLAIDRPDQVWCADITYVPMPSTKPVPGSPRTILAILSKRPHKTGPVVHRPQVPPTSFVPILGTRGL